MFLTVVHSTAPNGTIPAGGYIGRRRVCALYCTLYDFNSSAFRFQDVKLRASEKTVRLDRVDDLKSSLSIQFQVFNKLRKDIDIRYEIKRVETTSDKIFLLIQVRRFLWLIQCEPLTEFSSRF